MPISVRRVLARYILWTWHRCRSATFMTRHIGLIEHQVHLWDARANIARSRTSAVMHRPLSPGAVPNPPSIRKSRRLSFRSLGSEDCAKMYSVGHTKLRSLNASVLATATAPNPQERPICTSASYLQPQRTSTAGTREMRVQGGLPTELAKKHSP